MYKYMDFLGEDLGRVAKLRVDAKNIEFKGVEPKKMGSIEVAQVGKAKVVTCIGATQEQFIQQLKDDAFCKAVQNAWVLAVRDSEFCEEFAKIVHPYVAIANEEQAPLYERFSRGWNVADVNGAQGLRKCLGVSDTMSVEVLFGESRENPIGILSVKCLMD